jgi:hypothetical protein
MKSPNRDLLVLLKDEFMSEHAIEREVERLNAMLFNVESFDNISVSHELIDLNKYKIFHENKIVQQAIREKQLKPFVFLFNMN